MARKKKAKRKTTSAKKSRAKKSTAKRKKSTVRKTAARKKATRAGKPAAKKKALARRPAAAKPPARPPGAAKRPARRPAAARPAPSAPAQRTPSEERIGVVTHYFNHLSVATVRLEDATLRVGDAIRIHGHTTDFIQKVESLEVDHGAVDEVGPNDDFGLKVADHAREHDVVYRVRK
jgi:hypothetical protein